MNTIAAPKSPVQNRAEGFALSAIFQCLPTYASAVLLLKLAGSHQIVGNAGGAAIFVTTATLLHGLLVPWLGPKYPRLFKSSYEPLFFDAGLSFAEKVAQWRVRPITTLQLMTTVLMLSLLAVGVASMG
jgi:hypothetical protein